MSLISQSIPSFIGGVSQQAASQRLLTQSERQVNCFNSISKGMTKRPNTQFLADLEVGSTDYSDTYIHQIERDQYERYVVMIQPSGISVFDRETGRKYPVEYKLNYDGLSPLPYLGIDKAVPSNREAYQTVTSADVTYILNTTKAVYPMRRNKVEGNEPAAFREELTFGALPVWNGSIVEGYYRLVVEGKGFIQTRQAYSPEVHAKSVKEQLQAWFPTLKISQVENKLYIEYPAGSTAKVSMYNDSLAYVSTGFSGYRPYYPQNFSRRDLPIEEAEGAQIYEALVHIRQTDYAVNYKVTVNGRQVSHETPEATSERARDGLSIETILGQLAVKINGLATGVLASVGQGFIHLTSNTDFTVSASDDLNNQAIDVVKDKTQLFSDLPSHAPDKFRVKIIGAVDDEGSGYWVRFVKTGDLGEGHWEESRSPKEYHALDGATMPHTLTRKQKAEYVNANNRLGIYFEFAEALWDERMVGDDDAASFPSFCSEWNYEKNIPEKQRYITAMTFYKNRFVLASDENVVLSESGNFWNFFRTTAQVTKDSDRIDISVLSLDVNPIKALLPAQKELILYGERQQYALRSGDIFNANTVYAEPLMTYDIDLSAQPQAVGKFVYFAVNRERFNGIFESYVEDAQHNAMEVTAHCPEYIEGRVRKLATTGTEDLLLVLAEEKNKRPSNRVYLYNFKNQGNEKVQSAWSLWLFAGEVLDVTIIKSEAFFVMRYGTRITTERMNLAEDSVRDSLGVPVFLDRRKEVDAATQPQEGEYKLSYKGRHFIGIPYVQEMEMTELFLKDNNQSAIQTGRLQMRNIKFYFDKTTAFDVIVTQEAREERVVKFEGRRLGTLSSRIGVIPVDSGELKVPLLGRAKGMSITIRNDQPFDCRIQSADWEGIYHARARRI